MLGYHSLRFRIVVLLCLHVQTIKSQNFWYICSQFLHSLVVRLENTYLHNMVKSSSPVGDTIKKKFFLVNLSFNVYINHPIKRLQLSECRSELTSILTKYYIFCLNKSFKSFPLFDCSQSNSILYFKMQIMTVENGFVQQRYIKLTEEGEYIRKHCYITKMANVTYWLLAHIFTFAPVKSLNCLAWNILYPLFIFEVVCFNILLQIYEAAF